MKNQLLNLHRTGTKTTNVFCGLTKGNGERTAGCGAVPIPAGFEVFRYQNTFFGSNGSLHWDSVSLCSKCGAEAMANRTGHLIECEKWLASLPGITETKIAFVVFGRECARQGIAFKKDGSTRFYVLGDLPKAYKRNKKFVYSFLNVRGEDWRNTFQTAGLWEVICYITPERFAPIDQEKKDQFHPFGPSFTLERISDKRPVTDSHIQKAKAKFWLK